MNPIRQSCLLSFCERFSCCSGSTHKSTPSSPQSPRASSRKLSGKQLSHAQASNGTKPLSTGTSNGVAVTSGSGDLSNGQQVSKARAESQQTSHSVPNGNGSSAAPDGHCVCDTCRAQQSDRRTDADSSASSSGSDESHPQHSHYSHSQPSATPKHSVVHVTSSSAQNGTLDSLHSTHSAQCAHAGAPRVLLTHKHTCTLTESRPALQPLHIHTL